MTNLLWGEVLDIGWAPISAIVLVQLFPGFKRFAVFQFLEEILPATDFIPTFTIGIRSVIVIVWARENFVNLLLFIKPSFTSSGTYVNPQLLEIYAVVAGYLKLKKRKKKVEKKKSN